MSDVGRFREIEWKGCGCPQKAEAACPACDGKQPLTDTDRRLPDWYGHRPDCWLAALISAPIAEMTDPIRRTLLSAWHDLQWYRVNAKEHPGQVTRTVEMIEAVLRAADADHAEK